MPKEYCVLISVL